MQISLIHMSRAYFNAKCDPEKSTCVASPIEHHDYPSTCGLLFKHKYGPQAAADGWQQEYSQTLIDHDFKQGVASPCVFHHAKRSLVCSLHDDDFTTACAKPNLD